MQLEEAWEKDGKHYERHVTRVDYDRWIPRIGQRYIKKEDVAFTDIYEFDPQCTNRPPYTVKIRWVARRLALGGSPVCQH